MASLTFLWTLLLFPLSLGGAILFVAAVAERNWLAAAALAVALFLSLARLVGASRVSAHRDALAGARATVWRGEEYSVGIGLAALGTYLPLFAICGGLALYFALRLQGGWFAWLLAAFSGVAFAGLLFRYLRHPGKLLALTRAGIWDQRFGLVPWAQVESVDLLQIHIRGTRMSWLQAALHPEAAAVLAARPARRVRGFPIARLERGRVLQYQLDFLALRPEHALAAAQGWLEVARTGRRPSAEPALAQATAADAALVKNRDWMRRCTQGLLAAYATVPFAFMADWQIGWGR